MGCATILVVSACILVAVTAKSKNWWAVVGGVALGFFITYVAYRLFYTTFYASNYFNDY